MYVCSRSAGNFEKVSDDTKLNCYGTISTIISKEYNPPTLAELLRSQQTVINACALSSLIVCVFVSVIDSIIYYTHTPC